MDRPSAVSYLATRLASHTVDAFRTIKAKGPHASTGDQAAAEVTARLNREACEAIGIGEAYSEVCAFLAASARVDVTEG